MRILYAIFATAMLLSRGQQGMIPVIDTKPASTSATGLLNGWPMNEGSGTTFSDIASTTPTNISFTSAIGTWGAVTGFPATPFTFGGSDGAFLNSSTYNFNLLGNVPFSVCGWIRASSFPAGEAAIASTLNPNASFAGWELEVQNGHIRFNLVAAAPGNLITVDQTASLATSTTEQVCSTYSGSMNASGVTLYYAGTSTASTVSQNSLTSSATNSGILGIGIRNATVNARSNPFPGTIGYVSVWSCALSPTVIANNAAAGASFTGLHC